MMTFVMNLRVIFFVDHEDMDDKDGDGNDGDGEDKDVFKKDLKARHAIVSEDKPKLESSEPFAQRDLPVLHIRIIPILMIMSMMIIIMILIWI